MIFYRESEIKKIKIKTTNFFCGGGGEGVGTGGRGLE